MDPFELPGDPGGPGRPGDRGTKPKIHKEHYEDTETRREKEIRPEMAEYSRKDSIYNFTDNIDASTNKDADEDKEATNQQKWHSNNTSIIERLIKNHVDWEKQMKQMQQSRKADNETTYHKGADDTIPTNKDTDKDTNKDTKDTKDDITIDILIQRVQQQQQQQKKEMEEQ